MKKRNSNEFIENIVSDFNVIDETLEPRGQIGQSSSTKNVVSCVCLWSIRRISFVNIFTNEFEFLSMDNIRFFL